MKTREVVLWGALLVFAIMAQKSLFAQTSPGPVPTTDILGVHDFSAGTSPVRGPNANACLYCHAPHNALSTTPLWNQTLSTKEYLLYPGTTQNPGTLTSIGEASKLCLSCHDGSVAIGKTVGIGTLNMSGTLLNNLGTQLEGSHPFSLQPQINDSASLVASLAASHTTKDPAVKLFNNNIECSSCHDVHNQYDDRRWTKFLARDNTSSALCFACHDTGARTVNGSQNPLEPWKNSAHAVSTKELAPTVGFPAYTNLSEVGCSACHSSHNALGAGLLRVNPDRPANIDDTSQACITCHDGSDVVVGTIGNVLAEFNSPGEIAHPFADSNNSHILREPVVLNSNRHATCADCHNSHAAQPTASFPGTAAVRPSQLGLSGVSADGTVLTSATNQYENCLRCHGTSSGKQAPSIYGYLPARTQFSGDLLDVSLQFAHGAISSHPVMHDATNLATPSLLPYMWNIGFQVQGRPISSRILCTDCHNNDQNREFGGTAPNGPHGSRNSHILERQYVISQLATGQVQGGTIGNLNPTPILAATDASPYALCAKCHDLSYINSPASWSQHPRHIQDGFSCSVCHSAHGVPMGTTGTTGASLVTFDMTVVAARNNGKPVSYDGAKGCSLLCHNHKH